MIGPELIPSSGGQTQVCAKAGATSAGAKAPISRAAIADRKKRMQASFRFLSSDGVPNQLRKAKTKAAASASLDFEKIVPLFSSAQASESTFFRRREDNHAVAERWLNAFAWVAVICDHSVAGKRSSALAARGRRRPGVLRPTRAAPGRCRARGPRRPRFPQKAAEGR